MLSQCLEVVVLSQDTRPASVEEKQKMASDTKNLKSDLFFFFSVMLCSPGYLLSVWTLVSYQ